MLLQPLERETKVSTGKIVLGVFGAAIVITLIAVPTAIFLNDSSHTEKGGRTFSLNDAYNSSLQPRSYGLRWISDHEYIRAENQSIVRHDVAAGSSSVFLSAEVLLQANAFDYHLSGDMKYVAFASNFSKIWRHSFTASYAIYDLEKSNFVSHDIPHQVQYFEWAPTGNKLAYVWRDNVYVKASATSPKEQVTFSGKKDFILNGIPDWVYEEEMFSSNKGLWWSPGGKRLAYLETNDTGVERIEYSWYGHKQYPHTVSIPYPKPGTPNPTVQLFVVDMANTTKITQVLVPSSIGQGEHYLATVTWVTDERVAVQWLKRKQNHLQLQFYDFDGNSWIAAEHLVVSSSTGWVGRFSPPPPVFAEDKKSYYLLMSDQVGYKHIHHVMGGKPTPITSGTWEVISIQKVTADAVYFSSNEDGGRPGGRNVYKWTAKGKECLTCKLGGEDCLYNSASFSHSASFYRMSCSGPGVPKYSLRDNKKGTEVKVLEDNSHFKSLIADIQMPTMERATINVAGLDLWYQMTFPPGFDKSKKYPLLIDVYGGPCSQKAHYAYGLGFSTYLASTEKIIVASFDGRGSGYQGDKIMHAIYRRLGTYEVEDQISAAKEFIKMGFIDDKRIAIWGWSYGGYVSSMALGAGSGVFKCGMAVAPVSDWNYYDSIYTERYMELPSENPMYQSTTVMARAKNFTSVQYLLVHGTADDNVHFQQAAQISKALVEADVDFEAMWYTDKDHGLEGHAHHHNHLHMSLFLKRCFGLQTEA